MPDLRRSPLRVKSAPRAGERPIILSRMVTNAVASMPKTAKCACAANKVNLHFVGFCAYSSAVSMLCFSEELLYWLFTNTCTVAAGAFVICTMHSSAPWCFENSDIFRWLQTSGGWSVVLNPLVCTQAETNSRHLSGNILSMYYSLVRWSWFSDVTGCMQQMQWRRGTNFIAPGCTLLYPSQPFSFQRQISCCRYACRQYLCCTDEAVANIIL